MDKKQLLKTGGLFILGYTVCRVGETFIRGGINALRNRKAEKKQEQQNTERATKSA